MLLPAETQLKGLLAHVMVIQIHCHLPTQSPVASQTVAASFRLHVQKLFFQCTMRKKYHTNYVTKSFSLNVCLPLHVCH